MVVSLGSFAVAASGKKKSSRSAGEEKDHERKAARPYTF